MHKELFVVTKPVQVIEDGKLPGLVGLKRWRQNDAVGNPAGKNPAGDGIALDAARSGETGCGRRETNAANKKMRRVLFIAQRIDGVEFGRARSRIKSRNKLTTTAKTNARITSHHGTEERSMGFRLWRFR